MKKYLILLSIISSFTVFAQEKIPFIDIDEIALEVSNASQNGNYQKAVDLLATVNKNDSTYASVLVSKSYFEMALNQYDTAVATANVGLTYDCGDLKASFYQNKGAALISQEKYEEAIQVLEEALKSFPKNHMLTFNRAISLEKLGRIEEAVKGYEQTIILNPFYKKSYLQLGNLCYNQEQISQALMCFNMFLLLEPDADGASKVINSINGIVSGKNENKKDTSIQISKDDSGFEDIDLIITNRLALNRNYKIDNPIDVAVVKQTHMLLEQLKNYDGNGGFWDTKFVPFYNWIQAEGHFNDFVYTSMYSIENEKFHKTIKKNNDNILDFINQYRVKWSEIVQKNKVQWQGKEQEVTFYFDEFLKAVGTLENEITSGYWEFYNDHGRLTSTGNFDAKGNRDGKWTWYNEAGEIREVASYKAGELDGKNESFYDNGNPNLINVYQNGLIHGEFKKYNKKGALLEKKYFDKGELEGEYASYFRIGEAAIEYRIPYKNNEVSDMAYEYYADGQVFSDMPFKNGKRNGVQKKYFADGTLYAEMNYVDGDLDGLYKTYFINGKPSEVGQSEGGYYNGPWKTYYKDGTLQSDFTYANGIQDGPYKYYDYDGKLYYEYQYRKGEIIAYKFYDKTGAVIKEGKKKGGEFMYVGYAPNGNKTTEGLYDISGGKMGDWKFYTSNGTLSEKGSYTDNLAQGEYTTYYKNQKPKTVSVYRNDSLVGYFKEFHKNQQLDRQGWYKDDKKHGVWHSYGKDGAISIENFYHADELHGEQKYFSGTGKLYKIATYKYGELIKDDYYDINGVVFETNNYTNQSGAYTIKTHYSNKKEETVVQYLNGVKHGSYLYNDFYGNKRTTGAYVNGRINGLLTWFYKDGSVESTVNFLNGERHGEYLSYYENGEVESKGFYQLGSTEGVWINYYEDGTIDTKSEYEGDEYHGRREFYSPTGKLQLVRFYNHGRLIGYSYLGKDSKELPMIPIENETAKIKAYYDNGKVSRELEYKNGDVVNGYNTYYYSGQLENEMTYDQHELNGLDIEYYPDGTKRSEEAYILGDLHGLSKKYHPNGKLKEETNYANDEREGASKTYDVNGKLVKTEIYFNDTIISSETH